MAAVNDNPVFEGGEGEGNADPSPEDGEGKETAAAATDELPFGPR
jgi:hypothetical protein